MSVMNNRKKRKFAVFDIDGTIFRSSLLIELTESLVEEKIFSPKVRNEYAEAYKNWLDRKGDYGDYIRGVVLAFEKNINGVSRDDFLKVAHNVMLFHQNRVYRYTRDLVRDLKKRGYYLLAISGSPQVIVKEFAERMGFDKVYGRVFESNEQGYFTGKIAYSELIKDKAKILRRVVEKDGLTLKNSIGVGDTEVDIPFLKMVSKPIAFNPNSKFYKYAKRAGWAVVVERKDVIYKI